MRMEQKGVWNDGFTDDQARLIIYGLGMKGEKTVKNNPREMDQANSFFPYYAAAAPVVTSSFSRADDKFRQAQSSGDASGTGFSGGGVGGGGGGSGAF